MTFRRPKRYVLAGGCNVRDIGGHETADGRMVTRGLIYRSGVLSFLTPSDHNCIARFRLRTVVDLRRPDEIAQEPSSWPYPVHTISFPEDPQHGPAQRAEPWKRRVTLEDARRWLLETYATMPIWLAPHLRAIFQAVLARELPLLFHCAAGKDRTGFCTAVVLSLLGVREETVYQEYLFTNEAVDLYAFTKEHRAAGMGVTDAEHPIDRLDPDVREALLLAKREYLETALARVASDFGGIEGYAADALGLSASDIGDIRNLLLDD